MDAATIAAAALAIVVDESQQAAMQALLLERERLAMTVEDQASFLAQRHWVGTLQVWQPRPMTWQTAFHQRHNDMIDAHAAMRGAARALRSGDAEAALMRLSAEVGSEDSEASEASEANSTGGTAGEEEEEEEVENDVEVSPLAQSG